MKKNTLARTMRLAQLAMLIAIQAILTFTPLGFIMIPPISITIMHIPVIIGAKNATNVLRTGAVVTLDAERGVVLSSSAAQGVS